MIFDYIKREVLQGWSNFFVKLSKPSFTLAAAICANVFDTSVL